LAAFPVYATYATYSSGIFKAEIINLTKVDFPLPAYPEITVYGMPN